jgi:acetate kinase
MSVDALEQTLERRSGLLGMSGFSADVRELLAARDNPAARLALEVLSWRLRASLGAMTAVLGGVDLIVFTGGIGEHSAEIRASALDGGLGVGALPDEQRNATVTEGRFESAASGPALAVVAAREGWQLARAVAAVAFSPRDGD